MTETEWLNGTDPQAMLDFLREGGTASDRKLRLWACACVRRVWHLLFDVRSREAVEAAERFADGQASWQGTGRAARAAWEAARGVFDETPRGQLGAYRHAAMAAWWLSNDAHCCDVSEVINRVAGATVCDPDDPEEEDAAQAVLLRDIFGPFQFRGATLLDAAWLAPPVVALAQAAYDDRLFPSGHLDPAGLAVLAAVLESTGCKDAELLRHLRGPGPHVRGCFAIDSLLGKS